MVTEGEGRRRSRRPISDGRAKTPIEVEVLGNRPKAALIYRPVNEIDSSPRMTSPVAQLSLVH